MLLEAQGVSLTSQLSELKKSLYNGLPKGVKLSPPSRFNRSADSNSVKNFIAALVNCFNLMAICDHNK